VLLITHNLPSSLRSPTSSVMYAGEIVEEASAGDFRGSETPLHAGLAELIHPRRQPKAPIHDPRPGPDPRVLPPRAYSHHAVPTRFADVGTTIRTVDNQLAPILTMARHPQATSCAVEPQPFTA